MPFRLGHMIRNSRYILMYLTVLIGKPKRPFTEYVNQCALYSYARIYLEFEI